MFADDIAIGHEAAQGFRRSFEEHRGKITQTFWTPLNTNDYGPYIAQIDEKVDAVIAFYFGGNGVRFVNPYREYGVEPQLLRFLVALRATGLSFLMITVALGLVAWGLTYRWVDVTGGDHGLGGLTGPVWAGIDFSNPQAFFLLVLGVVSLSIILIA